MLLWFVFVILFVNVLWVFVGVINGVEWFGVFNMN